MSRKAWVLFVCTSTVWGSSFLLIRVSVRHLDPAAVVFGRLLLGAAFCVPLAARSGAFRGLRPMLPKIAVLSVVDMALPTFLTAWGEQHISSSLAGILTATSPLFVALLALWLIRSEAVDRWQFAGLLIGFVGVAALLGIDLTGGADELLAVAAVLMSSFAEAAAGLLYRHWLTDVPALGVTALMAVLSSAIFAVPGIAGLVSERPARSSILAVVVLGIVNTGLAYWMFYALIGTTGAASASVISYVMPVVALILGVSVLGESLTFSALLGLALIVLGAFLATRRQPPDQPAAPPQTQPPAA
jgi:drug/metabolite transporter (DMT)-like permease